LIGCPSAGPGPSSPGCDDLVMRGLFSLKLDDYRFEEEPAP
jgi:hypothetical protein